METNTGNKTCCLLLTWLIIRRASCCWQDYLDIRFNIILTSIQQQQNIHISINYVWLNVKGTQTSSIAVGLILFGDHWHVRKRSSQNKNLKIEYNLKQKTLFSIKMLLSFFKIFNPGALWHFISEFIMLIFVLWMVHVIAVWELIHLLFTINIIRVTLYYYLRLRIVICNDLTTRYCRS